MVLTITFPKETDHMNTIEYFKEVAKIDSQIEVEPHPLYANKLFNLVIEGLDSEKWEFPLRFLDLAQFTPKEYQKIVQGLRWCDPYLTQFESHDYRVDEIQVLNINSRDYGGTAGLDVKARIIKLLGKHFSHKKSLIHDFLHELGHIVQDAELGYTSENERLMLDLFQEYLADTDIPEKFSELTGLSLQAVED